MNITIRNKLRSELFDESDLIIAIFDKDLNYLDVNDSFLKVSPFKKTDIIGKNITYTSPDIKSNGRFALYKNVIKTGKTIIIDDMKPNPSLGNFHFRIKAFKVGKGLGTVTSNISDLKETIEELETFIYKSSHDMRAPIASILGLLQIAEQETKDIKKVNEYNHIVKQQTQRLDNVLKLLVETTRIRKGEKMIHLVDFKNLVKEVEDSIAFMNGFKETRIAKKISVKRKFYGDKQLIISLFQNLMDNAIKYKSESSDKSFVNISITDEKNGVKIIITDNGIGIPENLHNEVFKMFFRGTDKASGSGHGLYIVKHTVKKLGGQIHLKSKEKKGTTFTIYLPNEIPIKKVQKKPTKQIS